MVITSSMIGFFGCVNRIWVCFLYSHLFPKCFMLYPWSFVKSHPYHILYGPFASYVRANWWQKFPSKTYNQFLVVSQPILCDFPSCEFHGIRYEFKHFVYGGFKFTLKWRYLWEEFLLHHSSLFNFVKK